MSLSIKLNPANAEVLQRLDHIISTLIGPSREQMFDAIGNGLVANLQLRFKDGVDPQGNPWVKSQRAIREGGQTLINTGLMRNSFTYAADADGVDVGTNNPYAPFHQFGTKRMPQREILGISKDDEDMIIDIVDQIVGESL